LEEGKPDVSLAIGWGEGGHFLLTTIKSPVPEIIDPVFAKTSQNARFLLSEYERFGLVFTKTRVYKVGHWWYWELEIK
jgi:hypothetical protein